MTTANTKNSKNKADKQENTAVNKQLRSKAFRIALEMVGVFGGPAVVALLFGGWLENRFGWPTWTTYAMLAGAFILSWSIVAVRVQSFANELEANQQADDQSNEDTEVNRKQG
jgi:F0F1-type ATP synthase assembly protein I